MGTCGSSLNCAQCYEASGTNGCSTEVKVDPDIAGPGILIAFFLSATITCASIFLAYLRDSLPESLLSELDENIVRRYQASFFSRRITPITGICWRAIKAAFYRCTLRSTPNTRPPISRKQRIEAMERFLLGFGDQQLVTGIAILIASLANRCTMTIHELRIVSCLAWFSATTHSATLKVLREYFYRHGVVRNWRVLGVIPFMGLLLYNQVLVSIAGKAGDASSVDPIKPIQCVVNGTSLKADLKVTTTFRAAWLMVILVANYLSNTLDLFVDPKHARLATGVFLSRFALNLSRFVWPGTITGKLRTRLLEDASLQYDVLICNDAAIQLQQTPRSFRRYTNSFVAFFPIIMFGMTYGVGQMVMATWVKNPQTTDDMRKMGFGQVVAITLLVIPILTASEIYNEARTALTSTTTQRHNGMPAPNLHSSLSVTSIISTTRTRQAQDRDEEAYLFIFGKVKTLPIAREVEGIKNMDPDRLDFIARTLCYFVKVEQARNASSPHWRRARAVLQGRPALSLTLLLTLHNGIQVFGGVALNLRGSVAVAGNITLLAWLYIQTLAFVSSLYLRHRLAKHLFNICKARIDRDQTTHQAEEFGDDDGSAVIGLRRSVAGQSLDSLYDQGSQGSLFSFEEEDSFIGNIGVLRRQNTEADIELMPLVRRSTFQLELDNIAQR